MLWFNFFLLNIAPINFISIFDDPLLRCLGEKGNVVYELAKDKNLLERSIDTHGYYTIVQSDGQVIPKELSTKLVDLAFGIYFDEKFEQEKRSYHGSLGNFFAEKWLHFEIEAKRIRENAF